MKLYTRTLDLVSYEDTWTAMRDFTLARRDDTADEVWLLEHSAVYTLGLSGNTRHILRRNAIPIVHSDRGGQVTYHGPGQLVAYLLFDLKRLGIGIRSFVRTIEQAVIDLLAAHNITANRRAGAPGVYVAERKLAALGLRVRRGCTYHGLALNVNMDLAPFADIDPCGYPQLQITQLRDLGLDGEPRQWGLLLADELVRLFGYEQVVPRDDPP